MPAVDCNNTCTSTCADECEASCGAGCSTSCTGTCGVGCSSSATSKTLPLNVDSFTKDYMLEVIQMVLRYIILMANKGDILLSDDAAFSIDIETMYYVVTVTFNNIDRSEGIPVIHRYENVYRINRINNETSVTVNDYVERYNKYETETTETVGTKTIVHPVGSRVVKQYALYSINESQDVKYMWNGIYNKQTIHYFAGDPRERYSYYAEDVWNGEHTAILHYKGDVYVDDQGQIITEYLVAEYDTYWRRIAANTYTRDSEGNWNLVVPE